MGKWQTPFQRSVQRVAYDAGEKAFNAERPKSACPYPRGCREWREWNTGWKDAEYLKAKQLERAATSTHEG